MVSPLTKLPATVGKALSGIFLDATLTRGSVPDSPSYDAWDPPAAIDTEHSCKAIVENYSDRYRAEGLVGVKDRKVLVLADSLDVTPIAGDRVTISGITFTVVDVRTDPATAVWVLQGRM